MIFLPQRKLYNRDLYLWVHQVHEPEAGIRVDKFLMKKYPNFSRSKVAKIIKDKRVRVDRCGKYLNQNLTQKNTSLDQDFLKTLKSAKELPPVKNSTQVWEGDEIAVLTLPKPGQTLDDNIKVGVVYEDEEILVVNKPSGLTVHPSGEFIFNSLMILLQEQFKTKEDFYLCHRLDRETSGVLLISKTRDLANYYTKKFQDSHHDEVVKTYLVIGHGHCESDEFIQDTPIGQAVDSKIELKMGTRSIRDGGMESKTGFKVLKRFEYQNKPMTLFQARLYTGRQHQIRVHLLEAGFPVVGDKLYGVPDEIFFKYKDSELSDHEKNEILITDRHLLHAHSLSIPLPSGKSAKWETEIPDIFQSISRGI